MGDYGTWKGNRRGSVLVELALIGTMFFMLLVGIMDFGQFLFHQQALVERARYAARWGAVTDPANSDAIRNMVVCLQASGGTPSLGLTPEMVTVSTLDAGTDRYRLSVQISGYSFVVLSSLIAGRYPGRPIAVSVPLGLYH